MPKKKESKLKEVARKSRAMQRITKVRWLVEHESIGKAFPLAEIDYDDWLDAAVCAKGGDPEELERRAKDTLLRRLMDD